MTNNEKMTILAFQSTVNGTFATIKFARTQIEPHFQREKSLTKKYKTITKTTKKDYRFDTFEP